MSIPYTYSIVRTDPVARTMEIVYESPGHPTMHIGARLPFIDETVETVVQMYAPIRFWQEQEAQVIVPALGSGSYTPPAQGGVSVRDYELALDTHMDKVAQARRYDNRITCALRAGYSGPFQEEGTAFASWMESCNLLAYQILAEVEQGLRPAPATPQVLVQLMPAPPWPLA